jgi:hypothetical protein
MTNSMNGNNPFNVKKVFGLSVLLKLTEKSIKGVKIKDDGVRLTSNLSLNQINDAVSQVIKDNNITLKIK